MKLHVRLGPLPIAPPYFDWDDEDDIELDPSDDEDEIDLTDLLEPPARRDLMN